MNPTLSNREIKQEEYKELQIKYEKLNEEYEEHKTISLEYEKELEDINKDHEVRNQKLHEMNEKLSKEINILKEDYIQYKEKNSEKMKEIQYLETQNDKFKSIIEDNKNEKAKLERKIVMLENDNNDFSSKTHELECWADELKSKLDAALEENIILHSENEATKSDLEESLQRIKDELEDAKNEISSKEKIISRMTMHRDFILKTAYNVQDDISSNLVAKSYQSMKIFSKKTPEVATPVNKNMKIPEQVMPSYSKSFLEVTEDHGRGTEGGKIQNNNPQKVKNNKSHIFKQPEEDSIIETETNLQELLGNDSECDGETVIKPDSRKSNTIFNYNITRRQSEGLEQSQITNVESSPKLPPKRHERRKSDKISMNGLEKFLNKDLKGSVILEKSERLERLDSEKNEDGDDEEKEFIRQRIDMEVKTILDSRRNFLLTTLTQENFSFDVISKFEKFIMDKNIEACLLNQSNLNCIQIQGLATDILENNYNKQDLLKTSSKPVLGNKQPSKVTLMSNKNKRLVENIEDMLAKIQARKEKVILHKKTMQNKLEKIGIKIF